MLNNLICLKFNIKDTNKDCISFYFDLLKNHEIKNPIIFTDTCGFSAHRNIPQFHTFYIRHQFRLKNILIDYEDYILLRSGYHRVGKCLVLTDKRTENTDDIFIEKSLSYEQKLNLLRNFL